MYVCVRACVCRHYLNNIKLVECDIGESKLSIFLNKKIQTGYYLNIDNINEPITEALKYQKHVVGGSHIMKVGVLYSDSQCVHTYIRAFNTFMKEIFF